MDNDHDEEKGTSPSGVACQGVQPSLARQKVMPARTTTTPLESGSSDHLVQSSRTVEVRIDAPVIASENSGGLFEQEASPSTSSCQVLSSGDTFPVSEDMEPILTIILNERDARKEILETETTIVERASIRSMGVPQPARDLSELPRIDSEVIVTNNAKEMESMAIPTPLGRTRRLSLFERANSTLPEQLSYDDIGSLAHIRRPSSSKVSGVTSAVKGQDGESTSVEEGVPRSGAVSIRETKYNKVRDWLMHVLEKDDQLDTQVTIYTRMQESAEEVQSLWADARRRRRLECKTFEAADYELYDSKVWHTHKQTSVVKSKHGTRDLKRHRKVVGRWLTIVLGVAVGLIGCFVTYFTETIVHEKLHFVSHIIELHEEAGDFERYGIAFAWLWLINSCLTTGAFVLVWYKPWSIGSGIPETKCVLNGVSIPQVLAPSTLACKILGVILGVASGLPIGKEGPMIHAGAAIGGSIASLPRIKYLGDFRNDRDRRDLAAMGTAAGVAAAFRTPIGGVLFALEEGASFWTTFLTWRSFAAAVVTVVIYYLVFQGKSMLNEPLESSDIFIFGEFQDSDSSFNMWELAVFTLIATLGGLLGALFVACNKRLALFRARFMQGPRIRFIEVMACSTTMTALAFFLPLSAGECRPVPTDLTGWSQAGVDSLHLLVEFNCHHGEYNELATLFLNEQDRVIKLFFHFGEPGLRVSSVLLFALVFLSLQCVTSGTWVSSGLFIPSILSGSAIGRGVGELLGRNSRAYALVGGAAILGGISRMTLSVTVMMVEASGWVLFVIPLMLVFITARSVGNRINEGVYDTQISIKKMPFLEQEPPEETRAQNMRANQLMSKEVVCLRPIETVEAIMSILRDYDHNCFPVVEDRFQRVLLGVVHRKNLSVLLKHGQFTARSTQDPSRPGDILPELTWETLEESYPRYPLVHELSIKEEELDYLVDIAAYVQIGPHVINEHASAHRAYIMFRTLGLRHLVVVNHYNEVVGIITRENLLPEHFKHGGAYHTS